VSTAVPVSPEPEPEPIWPEVPLKEPPVKYTYILPYAVDTTQIMSRHYECRGRRYHAAYDLPGVGPDGGLGTPVVSMGLARITEIGRPTEDSRSFGRLLRRRGTTRRGALRYPTHAEIEGYGRVYFFTQSPGSWRSGAVVSTVLLEGPYAGYTVRYMHLGAIRPSLHVGDLLKPGTELGLLGGTGVQDSPPHLHVDLADLAGNRIDMAPLLGLPSLPKEEIPVCRRGRRR
jgi:murein DD-endopeptidase MepM/ murein hydrolase activator NlpD